MSKKLFFELKKLIELPLILAVCIFSGCATSGGNDIEPGTLTITGIPAEYNGKFISAIPSGIAIFLGENTAVANGEVNLPLTVPRMFGKGNGYDGNDTVDIRISVNNEKRGVSSIASFAFTSLSFENGIATVNWDDGFKVGITITINDIPAEHNDKEAYVFVNFTGGAAQVNLANARQGIVKNGSITVTIYNENGGALLPSATTSSINVSLAFPGTGVIRVVIPNIHINNVPVSDGKATVNFRQ